MSRIKVEKLSDDAIERQKILAATFVGGSERVKVERVEDPPQSLWLTAKVEDTSITYWAEVYEAIEVVAKARDGRLQTTWKVQCSVRGLLGGGAKVEFRMNKGASLPVGGVILKFDASPAE